MSEVENGNPGSPEPKPSDMCAKHEVTTLGVVHADQPGSPEPIESDVRLKQDMSGAGHEFAAGLPLYSFKYIDDDTSTEYVGVMAQDVLKVRPDAVSTGADGYYRVDYGKLGLRMVTREEWDRTGSCAAISPEPISNSISPEPITDGISPEPVTDDSDVRLKRDVRAVGSVSPEPIDSGISPEPTDTISDARLKREVRMIGAASPEPIEEISPEPGSR